MTSTLRVSFFLWALTLSSPTFANDLTGFWKAEDQPAWIEIQTSDESATGVVRRNDVNADAVGRTLLKELTAEPGSTNLWRGQIYAARLGEYRDAEVSLLDASTLQIEVSVGIMSRTFNWQRVEEIPAD